MSATTESLDISGARVHNLKSVDVTIPRNQLVVITGLSGSGKSSLAFDTIYAEGQRRYIETFSSYARQFLGNLERPDVDQISGLSPVISIEQKTTSRNPRSTVGTITEIYDFLRLLFARTSDAYSYATGKKMVRYNDRQIEELIQKKFRQKKIVLLAPLVKSRKGHYRELFEQLIKQGFLRARINGNITELKAKMQLDRYKTHQIEAVIDRIEVNEASKQRLSQSILHALKIGKGSLMVMDAQSEEVFYYSRFLVCADTGISYDDPAPNLFSFNSPVGSCGKCNGIGYIAEIDEKKIIPNPSLSIRKGGLAPIGEGKNSWIFQQLELLGKYYRFSLDTPLCDISEEAIGVILYGTEEILNPLGDKKNKSQQASSFEGIVNFISRQQEELQSKTIDRWAEGFSNTVSCPKCEGSRLKKEALFFKINQMNIAQVASLNLSTLRKWVGSVTEGLDERSRIVAGEIIKEIDSRVGFLIDVGLDYLALNRSAFSLSGGEAQRIRLATQIGSQLQGVLYILDEPSIGLHQRDNVKLIDSLKRLRDIGNSLIVVEHDQEMMEAADYILDIGPGAGIHGGKVVASGSFREISRAQSITADYLNGKKIIPVPANRGKGSGKFLELEGATGHNLKNIHVRFPLGSFICVTGVSGSGKSTLINETLYPALNRHFYRALKNPLPYKKLSGIQYIDKIIEIDQSPIGRTPRSNLATYTNVFNDIRTLMAELPESKIRGYKPGRFSFNVKGGRCETCLGAGLKTIEMNFLPDVYVLCEDCEGKRYNRETLEIRYQGKSISDILNLTVKDAVIFFERIPSICHKLRTAEEVGLGYITLGQSSTTLSGGEAQRIKLSTELSKKDTGNTFYILDEPSTGLHFEDIRILLEVLHKLVANGSTVLVIEHNLDIIKVADHVIDLGPEGGDGGGQIIFEGTPEELAKCTQSHTGRYLKKALAARKRV
ncbi:MAG: excinuclease ABC subunit UvrA [Bacteroidota bacterium]